MPPIHFAAISALDLAGLKILFGRSHDVGLHQPVAKRIVLNLPEPAVSKAFTKSFRAAPFWGVSLMGAFIFVATPPFRLESVRGCRNATYMGARFHTD